MSTNDKSFNLWMRRGDGSDYKTWREIAALGRLEFDINGDPVVIPPLDTRTNFSLLPASSVAAGTDALGTVTGTGTELITASDKGGCNLKTQATTPADGDNVFYAGVANTGFHVIITTGCKFEFRARIRLGTTAFATMFASFGLNENVTAVLPSGTAGEGAMFLYDPIQTGSGDSETTKATTGLTNAQHANWILAHKVNGADTFTATSVKVNADQGYEFLIRLNEDLTCSYYIDGILVGTGPALTSGDKMKVFVGAELSATPAGQADFDVRYLRVSRRIG